MSAVQALANGTYNVSRKASGAYDANGRWVATATPTVIAVRASVKPANGRDMQALPEAERTTETLVMFADEELKTRTASTEADLVTVSGAVFEVYSVKHWHSPRREYWEALLTKVAQ